MNSVTGAQAAATDQVIPVSHRERRWHRPTHHRPPDCVLLDAQTRVVLTGTPYHQDSLAWYAPPDGGPPSQVVAELVPAPIWSGDQAGWWGIEVRIDGYRVGELTHPDGRLVRADGGPGVAPPATPRRRGARGDR